MSLDVTLTLPGVQIEVEAKIFIREGGQNREISREEWDVRFPGRAPITVVSENPEEVYSANITGNLHKMAAEAGVGQALWAPEELSITHAQQLIEPLSKGLELLRSDPARFIPFNASNGWGKYDDLVRFVADYLEACCNYPSAEVSVSR